MITVKDISGEDRCCVCIPPLLTKYCLVKQRGCPFSGLAAGCWWWLRHTSAQNRSPLHHQPSPAQPAQPSPAQPSPAQVTASTFHFQTFNRLTALGWAGTTLTSQALIMTDFIHADRRDCLLDAAFVSSSVLKCCC